MAANFKVSTTSKTCTSKVMTRESGWGHPVVRVGDKCIYGDNSKIVLGFFVEKREKLTFT